MLLAVPAQGQFFERATALPPAEVDELSAASSAHLENAKRFLAEQQWADAVESIRRVQEADPDQLVQLELAKPRAGFERWIPAGEFCQWRLALLASEAPEALAHYRSLVDPLAEGWYREGAASNNEALLWQVVRRAFASRVGDDALLKLGDLLLARGDISAARAIWERIGPALTVSPVSAEALRAPVGSPLWLTMRRVDFAAHGTDVAALVQRPSVAPPGVYPDTDLDLASVRARLVLASILEGSRERARVELALLRALYPEEEGQLAGRRGRYADLLASLFEEASGWARSRIAADWPTFGGDRDRNRPAASGIDLSGSPLWTYRLPRLESDRDVVGSGRLRVAEDGKALLSYHPVVVGSQVLVRFDARGQSFFVALDLLTGEEKWRIDYGRGETAPVLDNDETTRKPLELSDAHADLSRHAGVARYTLTVQGGKVFARMGSPVTIPSSRRAALWLAKDQGILHGVDIVTQGKPLEGFPLVPPGRQWTFEGSPLVAGSMVYAVMRRVEGARSQLYIAAFERLTNAIAVPPLDENDPRPTGRLVWQTRIASSATLGGSEMDQLTHLLLTLDAGRLYLNTNAGVVAAISARDGRMLWLVKYPRAGFRSGRIDEREQHWFRDLVPCLPSNDLVIVAPSDCDRVFALHAASGELAWSLSPGECDDVVHLLGASGDSILASGERLYWLDAHSGRILTQFPAGPLVSANQAAPSPRGFGRGVLVDGQVWWPTREAIYVFDAQPAATDFGFQPRLVREMPLVPRGATGGNLVLANGVLLIATGDRLVAFGEPSMAGN